MVMLKKTSWFLIIAELLGGLVLLFIVAPLIGMIFSTTMPQIIETAKDKQVTDSIWLTIGISITTTIIFGLFAVPLAYLLARKTFPLKRLVLGIIDMPIVIPHSAAGIAILGFISRDSLVGKTAGLFGLNFVGHPVGIAFAMAFVSIPFLINAARNGFEAVPERLEKAALNLGASNARVFFTISVPLAWRSIVSGIIMMFARGMSEFGAIVIIAYHPMVTPVLIYERFNSFGLSYARPVSLIFIAVCLVFFILMRWLSNYKKNA